jgi:hypothetical protein
MPPGANLDKAAALSMNQSSWSLLDGGVSLDNAKTLSYIATKIMNYNLTGHLSPTNTITGQRAKKVYSEASSKIKFNLNEILSSKNCTAVAVMKGDTSIATQGSSIAALIAAENYFGTGTGINTTDTYDSNLTPADRELDPLNMSYSGAATNYLFLALAYYFSGDCEKGSSAGSAQKNFNIDFFTISSEPDTIIPLLNAQTGQSAGGEGAINSILKALPNAIKSLLLFNQGNNRYDWNNTSKDLMANANYKGAFALNYQNIKKIEVLGGFEQNEDGTVLVNAPQWVPLKKNIFDESMGQILLCRLVTFKSEAFGVKMPGCLELPVFHEYFILSPSNEPVPLAPINEPPESLFVGIPNIPSIFESTGDIVDYMSSGVGLADNQPPIT